MQYKVQHNPSENNFVCQLEEVHALLSYSRKSDALALERLFIPEHLDKDQVAGALVRAAGRYCQANELQIIPVESYLDQEFFPEHPEYDSLLREDEGPGAGAEFLRL